jgi:hypothetical protein
MTGSGGIGMTLDAEETTRYIAATCADVSTPVVSAAPVAN